MPDRSHQARCTEFIEPFRVEPGRKVRLPKDFDPGYTADFVKKEDAKELLQRGVELLAEYQARLAAQDTYGLLVDLPGDGRGRQGRHDPPRHERRQPAGRGGQLASRSPRPRSWTTTTCGGRRSGCPPRGMIGIFNRSYYEEVLVVRVHPEILAGQKLPPRPRARTSGSAASARSTTGSATSSTTGSGSSSCSSTSRRRSSGSGSWPASTSRRRTGSSPRPTRASGATGTTTRRRSRTCSRTRAPSGRPGTSSRPTASGSCGSPPAP